MRAHKRIRQYAGLMMANAFNVGLNLAGVLVLTRIMDQSNFGSYRYALTFFATVAVLAQLGVPYASSVLLARTEGELSQRRLITLTTLLMGAISLAIAGALQGAVLVARELGTTFEPALVAAVPFVFVSIIQVSYIEMLKGANRIADIGIQTCLPTALVLASSATAYVLLHEHVGFKTMLGVYACSYGLVHAWTFWRFRTGIRHIRPDLQRLRAGVREVGGHVYLGTLFAVTSGNILNLVLGHVIGTSDYAIYGLALSMSAPLQLIPAVMGTVLFKENAQGRKLSRRSTTGTVSITAVALAGYLLVLALAFPVLFPPSYDRASTFASYLAVAYALYGLGDYFNRFVGAHGQGRFIKRGAVAAGCVNVGLSLSLIWALGIAGVILGTTCAAAVYLALMLRYYRRTAALATDHDTPTSLPMTPSAGTTTSL